MTPTPPRAVPAPWTVGGFGLVKTERYRDAGLRWVALPTVTYRGKRLHLLGPSGQYRLVQTSRHQALWLSANWRFDGYGKDNGDFFDGLPRRRDTLETGLRFTAPFTPSLSMGLHAAQDALNRHGGQRLEGALHQRFILGQGRMIGVRLGLQWLSPRVADYYYGIDPAYATEARPAYRCGRRALTAEAGLNASMPVTRHWQAMALVSVQADSAAIQDSPLVDPGLQFSGALSLTRGV